MEDTDSTPAEPPSPGAQPATLSIDIADARGLIDPSQHTWLAEQALAALRLAASIGEVRARIVTDAEMTTAHERWSGIEGTTDVLTFDLRDEASRDNQPLDVDLLLCVDVAQRQADARGHTPERELLLYLIHGVLHCLGYDDHSAADAARMHAEEDRLLDTIGVGATFAPPDALARNTH